METLIFFLAIGAIQLIASYMKQKKEREEAARKAQRTQTQQQAQTTRQPAERRDAPPAPPPVESTPLPDPLREIMRQFGLPEESPAPPPPPPSVVPSAEKAAEPHFPEFDEREVRSYASPRKQKTAEQVTVKKMIRRVAAESSDHSAEKAAPRTGQASAESLLTPIAAQDLRKGIVWAAILQEPRFRRPWNPARP